MPMLISLKFKLFDNSLIFVKYGLESLSNGGMHNSASQKNVKLRNETLPIHKRNVKLHIFLVTRPPLARPLLVSAEDPW